jgi:hypothetical protein
MEVKIIMEFLFNGVIIRREGEIIKRTEELLAGKVPIGSRLTGNERIVRSNDPYRPRPGRVTFSEQQKAQIQFDAIKGR